jgi:hypothetical protein
MPPDAALGHGKPHGLEKAIHCGAGVLMVSPRKRKPLPLFADNPNAPSRVSSGMVIARDHIVMPSRVAAQGRVGLSRAWTVFAIALVTSACGNSGARVDADGGSPGDGGGVDAPATMDLSSADTIDLGRETIGSDNANLCCAPGEGTACCAGMPLGNCFKYGGIYGDCRPHGEMLEAKVTCAHCCGGLVRVSPDVVGADGSCMGNAPASIFICLKCGDGVCSPEENRCRCPADCP